MGATSPRRAFRSSPAAARTALFALTFALALVAPASAATPPPIAGGTPIACSADTGYVQPVADPRYYHVGGVNGVVTQWSFQGGGGAVALQTLIEAPTSNVFTPVGESAVETPAAGTLNTFATRIPVASDEAIGLHVVSGSPECLYGGFEALFNETAELSPAPVVGSPASTYGSPREGARLNVSVVVEPDDDRDGYGDRTQDGCPTKTDRADDCVKPEIRIDKTRVRKGKAKMFFSSNEPGGTFQCHLENKKYSSCKSPLTYKKLKPGRHTFTVRAIDANHNTSSQTSYWFRVKG
jgi:hypothetical protein